ncbi:hypothetical protein B0T22DRAFT_41571 [Podospora appendiculata]|uniref:Uncharacterized protein n=1 Tax=Podospora appendiculata TaxID=314037 RepID=A0AAE0XIB8_9PEZI|nr:hypothetical protein B0T22DRAFT_41571 [Podospora appendiculata]
MWAAFRWMNIGALRAEQHGGIGERSRHASRLAFRLWLSQHGRLDVGEFVDPLGGVSVWSLESSLGCGSFSLLTTWARWGAGGTWKVFGLDFGFRRGGCRAIENEKAERRPESNLPWLTPAQRACICVCCVRHATDCTQGALHRVSPPHSLLLLLLLCGFCWCCGDATHSMLLLRKKGERRKRFC